MSVLFKGSWSKLTFFFFCPKAMGFSCCTVIWSHLLFSSFSLKWHLFRRLTRALLGIAGVALPGKSWGSLGNTHLSFISTSCCPFEAMRQWFPKGPPPLFSHIFPALPHFSCSEILFTRRPCTRLFTRRAWHWEFQRLSWCIWQTYKFKTYPTFLGYICCKYIYTYVFIVISALIKHEVFFVFEWRIGWSFTLFTHLARHLMSCNVSIYEMSRCQCWGSSRLIILE